MSRAKQVGGARKAVSVLFLVLSLFAPCFILGGCWDLRELEYYAHVRIVGLDKGSEPDLIRLTVVVEQPKATGAGQSGASGGGASQTGGLTDVILQADGPTFLAAHERLSEVSSRIVSYSHAELVLIGEDLAREGIERIIDPFTRIREFRRGIAAAVADSATAEELLKTVRPDVETSTAAYLDQLIQTAATERGLSPYVRLQELYLSFKELGVEIILPLLKSEPKPPMPKPPGEGGGGGGGAGGRGQGGGGAEELKPPTQTRAAAVGTALFRGEKLVAKIDGDQTLGFLMVQGKFERGFITIKGPATQETEAVFSLSHYNREVSVRRHGSQVDINISVKVKAELQDLAGSVQIVTPTNLPALKDLIASELKRRMDEVINIAKIEVGGDVFGLGLHARPTFSTWTEWADFDWNRAFRAANIAVKVRVSTIRTGLTFQPFVPHE